MGVPVLGGWSQSTGPGHEWAGPKGVGSAQVGRGLC